MVGRRAAIVMATMLGVVGPAVRLSSAGAELRTVVRHQVGATGYVVNELSNTVTPIRVGSTVAGQPIPVGVRPVGIALAPGRSSAYVVDQGSNDVSVINTATNMVTTTIPVGVIPALPGVTPDGQTLYVPNGASNDVSVINTATNTVTATIPVGTSPNAVAVSPNGRTAYVANAGSNDVSVVNTATNTVTATVAVGAGPINVAVTMNGRIAYSVNFGDGTKPGSLTPIKTVSNTPEKPIRTGVGPEEIAITPNGASGLLLDEGGKVIRFNPANGELIVREKVLEGLEDADHVEFTPDGRTIYFSNFRQGTVSAVDNSTLRLIDVIHVGNGPDDVAFNDVNFR